MRSTLCMILAVAGAVHAQEVIDLHFYVRPPYMVSSGADQVTGLTAGPGHRRHHGAGQGPGSIGDDRADQPCAHGGSVGQIASRGV